MFGRYLLVLSSHKYWTEGDYKLPQQGLGGAPTAAAIMYVALWNGKPLLVILCILGKIRRIQNANSFQLVKNNTALM